MLKHNTLYINDLCNMLDFTQRTRQDWELFDATKAKAFEKTPEELAEIEQYNYNIMVTRTKHYLSLYNIVFVGNEIEFTNLYTLYILGSDELNIPMYEWIWSNNELQRVLQDRIDNFNTIQDFCQFILSYEQ